MLLAADIGNSSIRFGVFDLNDVKTPLCSFSVASNVNRSSDEYELIIRGILKSKLSDCQCHRAVISSVVPSVTHSVTRAVSSITSSLPFVIGAGTHTGFKIKTDDPAELGADMVSNAAAALSLAEPPLVIADLGTATTLSVVNAEREFIGSIIIPGARLSFDALADSAELLNKASFTRPRELVGKNSADSITSGVINGNIFMIDAFIRNLREQLCKGGESLSLIATGGLSELIIPHCRNKFTIVENLTLIGSAILYAKNRK